MNNQHFSIAQAALLEPNGLSETYLNQIMHKLTNIGGNDFADMFEP